jgi:hypothetical protein
MAGELRGQGPVQHLFAAVACSKRCAVAVLTAALPEEDAARQQDESLLGNLRRAGQNG